MSYCNIRQLRDKIYLFTQERPSQNWVALSELSLIRPEDTLPRFAVLQPNCLPLHSSRLRANTTLLFPSYRLIIFPDDQRTRTFIGDTVYDW